MSIIFSAYDLATNSHIILESTTPLGYFPTHVNGRMVLHDYLSGAAQRVAEAVSEFQDDDAPAPAEALEAIAAHFNDEQIVVEDHGDGPFLVDYNELEDED